MLGIMCTPGPKLTQQTALKQGSPAIPPAQGGSASTNPEPRADRGCAVRGYGRANGLPYEEYIRGNKDFAATWWDPDTDGPPTLGFPGGHGIPCWYVNDARRALLRRASGRPSR